MERKTDSDGSVLKVMRDVRFVWRDYSEKMFMGALLKGLET